jgi:NAD(P)-dependent dehydrogenase (short-subunit alcohol dehydrogenase family)
MSGASAGRLAGARVLVTGAASGIGRAIAGRCAGEGARVALLDLDGAAAERVRAEVGGALALAADVTDAAAVSAAVQRVCAALGGLDGVVNNVGIPTVGRVDELEEEDWDRALAADLKAAYLVSRAAWPQLVAAGGGAIANTASIAGIWATEAQPAYAAAKAATIMLTKCMALDGARDAIRVNRVSPGFVRTPMLERFIADQDHPAAVEAAVSARPPLGRLGEPTDIAEAFVYLLSAESRWVTGANLVVDGGLTAGIWG